MILPMVRSVVARSMRIWLTLHQRSTLERMDNYRSTALIVGVNGITGSEIARQLSIRNDWTVYGLSRSQHALPQGVRHVRADLQDAQDVAEALHNIRPTHVFLNAWSKQDSEAENIRVNGAMLRNLFDALSPGGSVQHAALMTGLKHYMGPFEAYGTGEMRETPFREESPRLDTPNFYYAQEDELFAAAERDGFTWSVHRAHRDRPCRRQRHELRTHDGCARHHRTGNEYTAGVPRYRTGLELPYRHH